MMYFLLTTVIGCFIIFIKKSLFINEKSLVRAAKNNLLQKTDKNKKCLRHTART